MEKKFDSIINDLNKEIDSYQQHRKKLYKLIMKIFYEDEQIIEDPTRKALPVSESDETVEMRLKKIIGRVNTINRHFGRCLDIMNNWV